MFHPWHMQTALTSQLFSDKTQYRTQFLFTAWLYHFAMCCRLGLFLFVLFFILQNSVEATLFVFRKEQHHFIWISLTSKRTISIILYLWRNTILTIRLPAAWQRSSLRRVRTIVYFFMTVDASLMSWRTFLVISYSSFIFFIFWTTGPVFLYLNKNSNLASWETEPPLPDVTYRTSAVYRLIQRGSASTGSWLGWPKYDTTLNCVKRKIWIRNCNEARVRSR